MLFRLVTPTNSKEQEHHNLDSEMGKKRKRVLTLSSQKIQVLNDAFSRDPNPNGRFFPLFIFYRTQIYNYTYICLYNCI